VASADRDAEVARLLAPGAALARERGGYTVLNDPEGHNFCVVSG
jgi:1-acyl-sn-glycerol-3-phosphate acyltransferase